MRSKDQRQKAHKRTIAKSQREDEENQKENSDLLAGFKAPSFFPRGGGKMPKAIGKTFSLARRLLLAAPPKGKLVSSSQGGIIKTKG